MIFLDGGRFLMNGQVAVRRDIDIIEYEELADSEEDKMWFSIGEPLNDDDWDKLLAV